MPGVLFDDRTWAIPPRLPLGDPFAGECHAAAEPAHPDPAMLRQCCNRGYGRGQCSRFPEHSDADAVRFHVIQQQDSELRIQYIFEKACWPVRHGVLEYASVVRGANGAILERQAAVFAESYLRRLK